MEIKEHPAFIDIRQEITEEDLEPITGKRFNGIASDILYYYRRKNLAQQRELFKGMISRNEALGKDVLELGPGGGKKHSLYRPYIQQARSYTVVDRDQIALNDYEEELRIKHKRDEVGIFINEDITELPGILKGNQFDLIFATAVIHHIKDQRKLLESCLELLKDQGRIHIINQFKYDDLEKDFLNKEVYLSCLLSMLEKAKEFQELGINVKNPQSFWNNRDLIKEKFLNNGKWLRVWIGVLSKIVRANLIPGSTASYRNKIAKIRTELEVEDFDELMNGLIKAYAALFSMDVYNLTPIEDFSKMAENLAESENVTTVQSKKWPHVFAVTIEKN